MTLRQHHFEVYVTIEDGVPTEVRTNRENAANWYGGTIFDAESTSMDSCWMSDEDDDVRADDLLALQVLNTTLSKGSEGQSWAQ